MQNMHKKHIFYQKNNASKIFFTNLPTLFFLTVTGNKQYFFLGLSIVMDNWINHEVWVTFTFIELEKEQLSNMA